MASLPGQPGQAITRMVNFNILDFNEAWNYGVAVASNGPYANHVHLAPDR